MSLHPSRGSELPRETTGDTTGNEGETPREVQEVSPQQVRLAAGPVTHRDARRILTVAQRHRADAIPRGTAVKEVRILPAP